VTRARAIAVGTLVVVVVGLGVAVALVLLAGGDESDGGRMSPRPPFVLDASPAARPFEGLTETRLAIGGRCLRVVVADSLDERVQGLRGRRTVGPYDGMLFAFDAPTEAAFTMSTVPVPLEIGFYDASGTPVSSSHLQPCPGADADCPDYTAGAPFTYALETLGGELPSGALSSCS
jgi:uncharacterized membrane protein (UPF0127 family)